MFVFKGAGEIFFGIETVCESDVGYRNAFIAYMEYYLGYPALSYVIGRREMDILAENTDKMIFGIARNVSERFVVKLVLEMRLNIVQYELNLCLFHVFHPVKDYIIFGEKTIDKNCGFAL